MGAEHADMAGIAIAQVNFSHVVIHDTNDEMQLQIRLFEIGLRLEERAPFGKRRREESGAIFSPAQSRLRQLRQTFGTQSNHVVPFGVVG